MATFTWSDLTLDCVTTLRILGIDPGTQVVGYGCLDLELTPPRSTAAVTPLALRASNTVRMGGAGEAKVVDVGVLRLGGSEVPLPVRLMELGDRLEELLRRLQPHELALEEAFYGKSVSAALRIGEARGVILCAAARSGLPIYQFPPARVKRSITGHGAASKEAVARMVEQLVRLPVAPSAGARLPNDATDALAVALARVEQRRSPLLQVDAGR
jgi:crossover junction endodeoxyribonuclease RuvC